MITIAWWVLLLAFWIGVLCGVVAMAFIQGGTRGD